MKAVAMHLHHFYIQKQTSRRVTNHNEAVCCQL